MKRKLAGIAGCFIVIQSLITPSASALTDPPADTSWVTTNHPAWGIEFEPSTDQPDGLQPFYKDGSGPAGSCRLIAWEVSQNPGTPWLGARGGRENCTNVATYKVYIMKHIRFGPDKVIAMVDGPSPNSEAVAVGRCNGSGTYYTRVVSSTGNSFNHPMRVKLCT